MKAPPCMSMDHPTREARVRWRIRPLMHAHQLNLISFRLRCAVTLERSLQVNVSTGRFTSMNKGWSGSGPGYTTKMSADRKVATAAASSPRPPPLPLLPLPTPPPLPLSSSQPLPQFDCKRTRTGPDPYGVNDANLWTRNSRALSFMPEDGSLRVSNRPRPFCVRSTSFDPYHLSNKNPWLHESQSVRSMTQSTAKPLR